MTATAPGLRGLLLCLFALIMSSAVARAAMPPLDQPVHGDLRGARYPALSPDGSLVIFEYWGDLWSAPVSDSYSATLEPARRLTDHQAFDQLPKVSPDGRWIAFSSDRSGNNDIWVMPVEGGQARQITTYSGGETLCNWTPDGHLVYSTRRGLWADDLFVIDPLHPEQLGEPLPRQLTMLDHYSNQQGLALPDGGWLFARGGGRWWRHGYHGTSQTDLWRMDSAGHSTRLTSYDGMDEWPMLTPDGLICFYVNDESGCENIWALNLSNGARLQLTKYDHDGVQWPSISADGKWIAYEFDGRLYRVSTNGGEPQTLAIRMAAETKDNWNLKVSFSNQADEFAAAPNGRFAVLGYQGDIWGIKDPKQYKADSDKPDQDVSLAWRLSASDGARERGLALAPDGRHLAYSCDEDGDYDIYVMDLLDQSVVKVADTDVDDLQPEFSPADSNVLFYYSGNRRLVRRLLKEQTENTVVEGKFRVAFGYSGFEVSPDGRWVAYSEEQSNWNGDIFIAPADGSTAPVNITRHPDEDSRPSWSPDGRRLSYFSSRGDETNLYVVDLNPEPDRFDTDFLKPEDLADGKDKDSKDKDNKAEGGKDKPGISSDSQSGTAEPPKGVGAEAETKPEAKAEDKQDKPKDDKKVEVKIDFRDIHLRARRISQHRNPSRSLFGADGNFIYYAATNDDRNTAVYSVNIETGEAAKLMDGDWNQPQLVDKGSRIWFAQGGALKYLKVDGGSGRGVESVAAHGDFWLDKRARFNQMYREAWRTMREQFYDPKLHGADWNAVYDKYRPLIDAAATPEEFGLVFSEVLGELNASHLGISMSSSSYSGPGHSTGHLGLEFDPAWHGPGLKVSHITYQGPADEPGIDIQPGDVLLKVEGQQVNPGLVWEPLLLDKSGQPVTLSFAPRGADSSGGAVPEGATAAADDARASLLPAPSLDADGNRTVVLKCWSYDAYREALYREWEISNEQRVAQLSGGRIGYIHIRGMNGGELAKFKREFYSEVFDKAAVIVDVRFNPGGFIHEDLFEILDRNPFGYVQQRDNRQLLQPSGYFGKPLALLINAGSGSDAEIFPTGWRNLKLGPIVGIDTAGAVIGTTSFSLVDGTTVRLPIEGWFDLDQRNLERGGTKPDIYVDVDPNELEAGKDAQLEAAVNALLPQLK